MILRFVGVGGHLPEARQQLHRPAPQFLADEKVLRDARVQQTLGQERKVFRTVAGQRGGHTRAIVGARVLVVEHLLGGGFPDLKVGVEPVEVTGHGAARSTLDSSCIFSSTNLTGNWRRANSTAATPRPRIPKRTANRLR